MWQPNLGDKIYTCGSNFTWYVKKEPGLARVKTILRRVEQVDEDWSKWIRRNWVALKIINCIYRYCKLYNEQDIKYKSNRPCTYRTGKWHMQVAGMAWGEQFINYMHELGMAISSVVQFIYPWSPYFGNSSGCCSRVTKAVPTWWGFQPFETAPTMGISTIWEEHPSGVQIIHSNKIPPWSDPAWWKTGAACCRDSPVCSFPLSPVSGR